MQNLYNNKGTDVKRGNSSLDAKTWDINKEILEAMRIIAKQEVNKAPRDITKTGLIKSLNSDGTYNVVIDNKEYSRVPSYSVANFKINDIVKVTYPQNQASNMYISGGGSSKSGGISALDVYPVGSIYLSLVATNPSTFFGGSWLLIGQGRTLVGVDTNQDSFNQAGKLGGVYSNDYTHAHTTQNHVLTINEIPNHQHGMDGNTSIIAVKYNSAAPNEFSPISANNGFQIHNNGGWFNDWSKGTITTTLGAGGEQGHTHGDVTLTTQTISTVQPYLCCYIWQRTS